MLPSSKTTTDNSLMILWAFGFISTYAHVSFLLQKWVLTMHTILKLVFFFFHLYKIYHCFRKSSDWSTLFCIMTCNMNDHELINHCTNERHLGCFQFSLLQIIQSEFPCIYNFVHRLRCTCRMNAGCKLNAGSYFTCI